MHSDTISEIWYSRLREQNGYGREGEPIELKKNNLMIDIEKLRAGDCLCQNFGCFVQLHREVGFDGLGHEDAAADDNRKYKDKKVAGAAEGQGESGGDGGKPELHPDPRHPELMDPWWTVNQLIGVFKDQMAANSDTIRQVRSATEIEENEKKGLISALLTIEEGGVCEGSLDHLRELYDDGARMMTLTWNHDNELGHPNRPMDGFRQDFRKYYQFVPRTDDGLTKLGREFVEAMQDMNMILDVSHLSDAGFYDAAQIMKGPFVASHSNARALCGCNRDMSDDMIRIVGEHGGVIGLNFCSSFVMPVEKEETSRCTLELLAKHARHMMDVGGAGVVGFGSDFDGIDDCGRLEIPNASKMPLLIDELKKQGFCESEIEGIYHGNVMRVYHDVLG